MGTAARTYFCLGVALIAIHLAVGGSTVTYEALGFLSAAAVAAALVAYRPPNRAGWFGILVAQLLFFAGDVVYQHETAPGFPGVPDVLYLCSYAIFIPSLFALARPAFPWRDWGAHVDATLIATCVGVAAWMIFPDGTLSLTFTAGGVVSAAYLAADVVALAVMLRLGIFRGGRPPSYWLMLAALLPLLVADGSYVLPALSDQYHLGSWLDVGWLGSYVLVGTAALHPSMARIAAIDETGAQETLPLRRVIAGGVALLMLPLAEAYELIFEHDSNATLLTVAALVLIGGMVARAAMLVRELERQRALAEESERKFRMVFERSPIGISIGRDGIMSETNPALHRMLGFTAEEFANMHYTDVTHPDEQDLDVQVELDAGLRDHFTIDKRYVGKDGEPRDAHIHVVLDASDGLGISLIEDVTQRRDLEEQLRQSQKMDAIGKLAGGIAHDFNNLMTAVLGYSDLLLSSLPAADPSRDKIEGIRDAAGRAADLTRQLLAFGRRQMLQVDDVDLCQAVSRSEGLLRRLIGEDVKLRTILAGEPVIVRADPSQLDQVIVNLAVNAREAMPRGGTLTLGVSRDGDDAVLTVSDTGVGMDEELRTRVFEPFFTTKAVGEGSGLGLSTVDGIVAQSGGTIAVASEPGTGTVFTIRLPQVGMPATVSLTD